MAEPKLVANFQLSRISEDSMSPRLAQLDETVVQEYAEILRVKEMDPIHVFYDGKTWWLGDGRHRVEGAKWLHAKTLPAITHRGTKLDAFIFNLDANGTHGRRLTQKDRRHAVELLLKNRETRQWSDTQIAEACGVTQPTVGRVRKEMADAASSPKEAESIRAKSRKTSRGTQYTVPDKVEPDEEPNHAMHSSDEAGEPDPAPEPEEAPVPEPMTGNSKMKDATGALIPKAIARIFMDSRTAMIELQNALTNVRGDASNAYKLPGGKGMNIMQITKWLDDARVHVGQTMPHAVCKKCNAANGACDRCGGKGWMTKVECDVRGNT